MTPTATPSAGAGAAPTLTASDRCDRCGAQARVRATLASGELFFCSHHAKEHEARLRELALEWYDESALTTA
jgi:hypothetical protein